VKRDTTAATRRASQALPRLAPKDVSASDGLLLAGGLALFVFVLADTILLVVSSRYLRGLS
jgi:hypothetical protein